MMLAVQKVVQAAARMHPKLLLLLLVITTLIATIKAVDDEEEWVFPSSQTYKPYIVNLMSWFHAMEYDVAATFTRAELLELSPTIIKRWMLDLTYGDPLFDADSVDVPDTVNLRASSLAMMKKAVSFFMPNKGPQWLNGQGNPTKHEIINRTI